MGPQSTINLFIRELGANLEAKNQHVDFADLHRRLSEIYGPFE